MAFRSTSTTRKVVDYLASGKTITAAQARSRFGVANFRACISKIKATVEAYGNHEVTSEKTITGKRSYSMHSRN